MFVIVSSWDFYLSSPLVVVESGNNNPFLANPTKIMEFELPISKKLCEIFHMNRYDVLCYQWIHMRRKHHVGRMFSFRVIIMRLGIVIIWDSCKRHCWRDLVKEQSLSWLQIFINCVIFCHQIMRAVSFCIHVNLTWQGKRLHSITQNC